MDAPELPPSDRKDDSPPDSAAATAPRPSSGKTSPSPPFLTLSPASDLWCAQVDADADAEPPSKPNREGSSIAKAAAEKRAISGSEYELVAARLRRRRTRALPVEAPAASPTKPSPSAARSERPPAAEPNPSAAAAANLTSIKPDHLSGGGESGAAKSSGSAPGDEPAEGGVGRLSSYERIEVLGEGGFATVWKARDTRTGELVAIKSALKRKGEEDGGTTLLREAALLAACRGNPAVVGFREVLLGPGPGAVHIVMDLVGSSLRRLLDARRQLTEAETRDAMRQLLAGAEALRSLGITHGDLKPENVLIGNRDGHAVYTICDLGLAISVSEPPRHIPGTLYYAAPEQLLGEKDCGPPVDAWALGCIMAELITGEPLIGEWHETVQWTRTIFMLGVPDDVSKMDYGMDASTPSDLRNRVPEGLLTPAGFDVLQGLLQYEQEKRLTPAEALKMPWFSEAEEP